MDITDHYLTAPDAAEQLLTCFFAGCEKEFGFLQRKHDFTLISGLSQYRQGRRILTPFRMPASIPSPFEAVVLFEKDDTAFEISYGGNQHILDMHLYYGQIHRFLLRAVFEAARKAEPGIDTVKAQTVPVLEQALAGAGVAVRKNMGLITKPSLKLIGRTLTIHDKRLEQAVRMQHRRDMEDAAQEAARAFTAKNYLRVLELLMPYESYLSAANAKKLYRARQYLTNI
jgi:hypothetical protein